MQPQLLYEKECLGRILDIGSSTWLCHVGYKNFENTATNLRFLAVITGGEGLHNNHHGFPRSPKFSISRNEIDPAWPIIKLFTLLKLARPHRTIEGAAGTPYGHRRTIASTSGRQP